MSNCPMKGQGKGLNQIGKDGDDSWGSGSVTEEARALSSLEVMQEDKKANNSSSNSFQTLGIFQTLSQRS